jgi:hypothetical protein
MRARSADGYETATLMKLYRLSGLMLRWNFPLMNPCCAVMFSFTSCHHFTNSVSFPLGTEKTLINVTAIVNLHVF